MGFIGPLFFQDLKKLNVGNNIDYIENKNQDYGAFSGIIIEKIATSWSNVTILTFNLYEKDNKNTQQIGFLLLDL